LTPLNIQTFTITRITDKISKSDTIQETRQKFIDAGKYTAGAEKAIDYFYDRETVFLRGNKRVTLIKKTSHIYAQNKLGRFIRVTEYMKKKIKKMEK